MVVTLLVPIVIAVWILLDWLRDIEAGAKKPARDDKSDFHHKR